MQDLAPDIERVYRTLSAEFLAWTPSPNFQAVYAQTAGRLLTCVEHDRPVRIIELGCGHGTWLKQSVELLRDRGRDCEAIGLDLSTERLRLGREYLSDYPEASLQRANLLEYEPTGEFDLVAVFEVFQHFSFDEQRRILRRWIPHIEPEGALVVVDKDRRSRHSLLIEAQKRLGRLDWLLGRFRRFPPSCRDLLKATRYPDFYRLLRMVGRESDIDAELVRHGEFTALVARRA
jgi:trans-aconitate methyltransferase